MWTIQVPVISSAHITQETAELLTQNSSSMPVPVATYRHGWFAFIFSPDIDNGVLPADLEEVAAWYRQLPEFDYGGWLRLDSDGDVVPELPTYDW